MSIKVGDVGGGKGVSSVKRKAATGKGDAFSSHLKRATGTADSDTSLETQAAGQIEGVLAVQEVPDATEERSRGLLTQYGDNLLERLDQLRLDLLSGQVPKERLSDLAQTMRAQRQRTNDPQLNDIIDEIELRAEVEIAKLTSRF